MAQLYEYIKMAIDNIRANKGRSFLTMLGIIIGISSVIMIMAIGGGAKASISDSLNAIAGGQIYIYSNTNAEETAAITPEDMDFLKEKVEHIKGVTPADNMWGMVKGPKGEFDFSVQTGTADLEYTHNPKMKYGHYFTDSDVEGMNLTAVIGQKDAMRLFGTDDVVGMTMEASIYDVTQEVTICGVINEEDAKGGLVGSMFSGGDRITAYMPYTSNYAFGYILDEFSAIYIITEGAAYTIDVGDKAMQLLQSRHRLPNDSYLMQDGNSEISQVTGVLDMLTAFIAFVAAIALLVGGIGVMNIMLVSVTERTREIGIRKALGARTGSILMQFLAESAIITCIGGVIGIIIGVAGAYGVCSLPVLGFAPRLSVGTILLATLFSSCVGIFFGIYPARKAAKMSPIDALRRN